jgi:oligo-1,6-glucosidase
MTNYPFVSAADHRDIEALNHWQHVLAQGMDQEAALAGLKAAGRDNARTPMQWDAAEGAGFTTGTPWLPVHDNHQWLNAAAQRADPTSVLAHYRSLIRLRHELPILVDGDFAALYEDDPNIWAYTRSTPTQRLLVIANCSRRTRLVHPGPTWVGARLVLANLAGSETTLRHGHLHLAGWDARIYLLQA